MRDQRSARAAGTRTTASVACDDAVWALPVLKRGEQPNEGVEYLLAAAATAAVGGDARARDALFLALAEPIAAQVARYRRRAWSAGGAWDFDDVRQEAYLAFVEAVDEWPGGTLFVPFFVVRFRQRLADAVRRLERRTPTPIFVDTHGLLRDESAAAEESLALIEAVAAAWPEPDRTILLLKIKEGQGFGIIARSLGLSRRTVSRRWARLRDGLRATLTERLDGG